MIASLARSSSLWYFLTSLSEQLTQYFSRLRFATLPQLPHALSAFRSCRFIFPVAIIIRPLCQDAKAVASEYSIRETTA